MEKRQRRAPTTGLEVPTPTEMAAIDRAAVDRGVSFAALMDRAGYAVADAVSVRFAHGTVVAVVAGPGNNGGDAFVAGRVLVERGYSVLVVDLAGDRGSGAEASAARQAFGGQRVDATDARLERAAVVVDGLFGCGLSRDVAGPFADLVRRVNASAATVIAIDIASGVDGATGAVRGVAVEADRTVTFQRRKPGHLLMPGRTLCGIVSVADIGIPDAVVADAGTLLFANEPELWRGARPRLAEAGHKYGRGHAVVVSGPMAATGAARMAAVAALRSGAGLVTVASPADALLVNASHLTAVMLAKVDGADALADLLADPRRNAVCLGPGLPADEATRDLVRAALGSGAATVLDAGALMAFADDAPALANAIRDAKAVLTPHPGEFARLFGPTGGAGKVEDARRAAAAVGATVILKGADTVIAAPDGRAAINANAPPWLATAGAGDVLAGIVTAFLAQGVAPFEAAAMAVWLHGDLGTRVGPALIATDLLEGLKSARAAFDTV